MTAEELASFDASGTPQNDDQDDIDDDARDYEPDNYSDDGLADYEADRFASIMFGRAN